MPEIHKRDLPQHLFSFVKARMTQEGWGDEDVVTDFMAWVLSRKDTLDAGAQTALSAFKVIDEKQMSTDFYAFVMQHLPDESETARDFALRYQRDCIDRRILLSIKAHKMIADNLKILPSASAAKVFGEWYAAEKRKTPDIAKSTFRQLFAAFRLAVLKEDVTVPTGLAAYTIAQSLGLQEQYDKWVTSTIQDVKKNKTDLNLLPKAAESAACWNWALMALADTRPNPDDVITWLHAGKDTPIPAAVQACNDGTQGAARDDLIATRAEMLKLGLASADSSYREKWASTPELAQKAVELAERVIVDIVALHGYTILNLDTPRYAIGAELKIADGISWEHWWIEIDGTVIETFPTQAFFLNMTSLRQVDRMDETQKKEYRVLRIPVKDLLPAHYTLIRAGLAQYL